MASTSAPRNTAAYARIKSAAATLCSDNHSLAADIRKAMNMMKEIAVDFERDNQSEMVKALEDGVLELLQASVDCTYLSNTIQSVGNEYQPGPQMTNFTKLFDDKLESLKSGSSSVSENNQFLRQFREAVWNVHHAGQPMPGEEQEDIIMTSTQTTLRNVKCPITGKPVTELADPVRSMDCKHIYEKNAIMQYLRSKGSQANCPVAGCPKILQLHNVRCDSLLLVEIDELRLMNKQNARGDNVEDFTALDEED